MILTSSSFGSAIGLGKMSRAKLWRIKTGKEDKIFSQFQEGMLAWGNENELNAVWSATSETGIFWENTGEDQKHYTLGQYGTTPDGTAKVIVGDTEEFVGVEVKCPTTHRMRPLLPDEYMPQIQGQCHIANLDRVFFCVWKRNETIVYVVPRSKEYWDEMEPWLKKFIRWCDEDIHPPRKSKNTVPDLPEVEWITLEELDAPITPV